MWTRIVTLTVIFLIPFFTSAQTEVEHEFIGVEACVMCHKSEKQGQQLMIWQNSQHSKAYETLQTEKANQIAKEKGFETPAAETTECLKCHTSGYNVDESMLGKKFKIEDGVQCETCHGPGGDYKSLKIMKDRELAIQNGLKVYEEIESLCITCHNAESPTFVDMDIMEAWEKIKHPVPSEN